MYLAGSTFEGSTTQGLCSDILCCDECLEVIQDIKDIPANECCLLTVQDVHTKPGYVKLQRVSSRGIPLFVWHMS